MTKKKAQDTHLDVLKAEIRFARRVVNECSITRIVEEVNLWVLLLLAKIAHTGESVALLLAAGQLRDAKFLIRSMYESAVDVSFILDGPYPRDTLWKMARVEMRLDELAGLEFDCIRRGTTLKEKAQESVIHNSWQRSYKGVKREAELDRQLGNADPIRWPPPWHRLSRKMKVKHSRIDDVQAHLDYTIIHLGDSEAHSRFRSLVEFLAHKTDGSKKVRKTPRRAELYDNLTLSLEATFCIAMACAAIIEKLFLDPKFKKAAQGLCDRFRRVFRASRRGQTGGRPAIKATFI